MSLSAHRKITGIILAAGRSTRMEKTKQLLPFGDSTILGTVIENALESDLDGITLVLGHEHKKIKNSLKEQFRSYRFRIVVNPDYEKGQSTSLICGIKSIDSKTDAAMFLLGDLPCVGPRTIDQIISGFDPAFSDIVVPCFKGKRGNPVIISQALFPELETISADTGARTLFSKYQNRLLKIEVDDPGILMDIDTPDDYNHVSDPLLWSQRSHR